jgi:phage tail sheath protein FI
MPQAYSTPGVYRLEKDLSNVVRPLGTSTGAMVGKANVGPVNQRILVNTDKQFVTTFGTPVSSDNYAHYGAIQFLAESQNLWMVRCSYGDEKYSNVLIPTISAGTTSATSAASISAMPTSTALADTDYADGYTLRTQDTDPGIGDIEEAANASNYITFASIGPGSYGNDLGIAVIVPSMSAISGANGFNWKYKYDNTPDVDSANAIWKKVYRVNVYTKSSSQDATAAWGTGSSAITANTPVESFFVSNDPTLKDANGKSLYAPFVINGVSAYIYIKKAGLANIMPSDVSNTVGVAQLTSGVNGTSAGSSQKASALDLYADRTKVGVNILIVPDEIDTTVTADVSYVQKAGNIAAARQDCIAAVQCSSKLNKTRDQINSALAAFSYNNPSYVAPYVGYDKIYDSYTDSEVYVPKSVAGACLMARTDRVANTWDAPAGVNRGIIGYSIGQNTKLSEADIGSIYDNNANTSKFVTGYGHVMWGQKTAQKKASALDRINVRRLLLYIENTIEPSLLPFLYELNNDRTRSRVFAIIDQFLSTVQAGGGLTQYKVVCDASNNNSQVIDNNQLNVDIYVQPAKAIEFIQLQTIITRSGVDFNEVV